MEYRVSTLRTALVLVVAALLLGGIIVLVSRRPPTEANEVPEVNDGDGSGGVQYPLRDPVTPPPPDPPPSGEPDSDEPASNDPALEGASTERIRAGHEAVREANRTEWTEDYVEAIDGLNREHGEARVRDLASCFGVTHVAISQAMERLRREGLLASKQQEALELTDEGRALAVRSRERHAAVLRFFLAFGIPPSVAASDAEGVEHHVGAETLAAFQRYVDANAPSFETSAAREAADALVRPTDPERFARVRAAHATELTEDYVEAIDDMLRERGEARVAYLAERFGVRRVTATRMVSRLRRMGYVTTKQRMPLELSDAGRELAESSRARHVIVRRFLLALGVPENAAEIDAEGVEHHVSSETLRRFAEYSDGR